MFQMIFLLWKNHQWPFETIYKGYASVGTSVSQEARPIIEMGLLKIAEMDENAVSWNKINSQINFCTEQLWVVTESVRDYNQ